MILWLRSSVNIADQETWNISVIHFTIVSFGVINPKITSEIGWWVYQDGLHITSVKVEKDPKGLGPSWLHNKADVIITIEGDMTGRNGWTPIIESLHMAQQKPSARAEAIIAITPVVSVKSKSSYSGQIVSFRAVKKISLPTMNWGPNKYQFQIGQYTHELVFQCSK